MPHTRPRNPSPIPEVTWDSGFKEMNETWKGAIACLGVAVFFVMTIGIIYWQVVDQPNKNWIVRGSTSGLIWERRSHSLILQTLSEEKTVVEIDVGNFPDMELPFVKNLCWLNKTEFCYTWDDTADLKISFEPGLSVGTECYSIYWTPLHCELTLKVMRLGLFHTIISLLVSNVVQHSLGLILMEICITLEWGRVNAAATIDTLAEAPYVYYTIPTPAS